MKKYLLVSLLLLSLPALASYPAPIARRDTDIANHINRANQYSDLLGKVETLIREESSRGSYTTLFDTRGYDTATVEHVVKTLIYEGYKVGAGSDYSILTISWEQ